MDDDVTPVARTTESYENFHARLLMLSTQYHSHLQTWENMCAQYQRARKLIYDSRQSKRHAEPPETAWREIRGLKRTYLGHESVWTQLRTQLFDLERELIAWLEAQHHARAAQSRAEEKEEKIPGSVVALNSRLTIFPEKRKRKAARGSKMASDFFARNRIGMAENSKLKTALERHVAACEQLLSLVRDDQMDVDYVLFFAMLNESFLLFDDLRTFYKNPESDRRYMPRPASITSREQVVLARRALLFSRSFLCRDSMAADQAMSAEVKYFLTAFVAAMKKGDELTDSVYQKQRFFGSLLKRVGNLQADGKNALRLSADEAANMEREVLAAVELISGVSSGRRNASEACSPSGSRCSRRNGCPFVESIFIQCAPSES